jgi:hypothetical protein
MLNADRDRLIIPPANPEFEAGRLDALGNLEKTINRQIIFLKGIMEETENMAYGKVTREGMLTAYEHVLGHIKILQDYEKDKNILASLIHT